MATPKNIEYISHLVINNFDKIAEVLDVEYNETESRITMPCPVHGGDNNGACVIFKEGGIVGNWNCFTHSCEKQYGISILGFIKGALENKYNKEYSYHKTISFIERVTNSKVTNIEPETVRNDDLDIFAKYLRKTETQSILLNPSSLSKLKIPSRYYVQRGYTADILEKYRVGFCNTKGKPFYLRTVVPVFTNDMRHIVGLLGRTINGECPKCKKHHYSEHKCPENNMERYFASKWVNSKGFKKTDYLYNSWFAREHIRKTKTAILVEGCGDTWRLEECGIHNSLGIFGCKIDEKQISLLDEMGVQTLRLCLDNDEAGRKGTEDILDKYSRYFNIEVVQLKHKDIGDTPKEEIEALFK